MIARPRWAALAAAVLALVVVAVVARSHPSHPFHRLSERPASAAPSGRTLAPVTDPTGTAVRPPVRDGSGGGSGWFGDLLLALLVAGAVLALGRFTAPRWALARGGRTGRLPPAGVDLSPASATTQAALSDAVQHGIHDIDHGPVTDAIVSCWVRVETAAEHAGVAARPSETSTEFVDRVLGTYGARERELRRMAALYREARFSSHDMGEAQRDEARACLQQIRADLGGDRAGEHEGA